MLCIKTYTSLSDLAAEEINKLLNKFLEYNIPKKPLFVDNKKNGETIVSVKNARMV